MSKSLIPSGGDNRVYTPEYLVKSIITHYNPTGLILDPCMGHGVFYDNFPTECQKDWCEIDKGIDFFNYNEKVDWIITNPPWGKPFLRQFLRHSMEIANNVVFLTLINAFFMRARLRDLDEFGFKIKEIALIEPIPSKPWPQAGLALGATHIQKGYKGDIKFSKL